MQFLSFIVYCIIGYMQIFCFRISNHHAIKKNSNLANKIAYKVTNLLHCRSGDKLAVIDILSLLSIAACSTPGKSGKFYAWKKVVFRSSIWLIFFN